MYSISGDNEADWLKMVKTNRGPKTRACLSAQKWELITSLFVKNKKVSEVNFFSFTSLEE